MDDRLFLPSLQAPDNDPLTLKLRVAELELLFQAVQEENSILEAERDELVAAIQKWAKADRQERQELLFDVETQDLRNDLKQARKKVKELEREVAALQAKIAAGAPQQMRA